MKNLEKAMKCVRLGYMSKTQFLVYSSLVVLEKNEDGVTEDGDFFLSSAQDISGRTGLKREEVAKELQHLMDFFIVKVKPLPNSVAHFDLVYNAFYVKLPVFQWTKMATK